MEQYDYILEIFKNSIIPVLIALYLTEKVKGNVKNSFDKKLEDLKNRHLKFLNFKLNLIL